MNRDSKLSARLVTVVRVAGVLGFLYLFLVGVGALEAGIGALGSGVVDSVFTVVASPFAGLAAGVLATVLVQSSSVTTSTIVGLVGAGVLPVGAAVPMVMGANIGTTVTNTLASLGHLRQGAYFQRAFAAATIHDYFNLLAVAVLFPLELAFGLVSRVASWLASTIGGDLPEAGDSSPIKSAIKVPIEWIGGLIQNWGLDSARPAILLLFGVALIFAGLWVIAHQMKGLMSGSIESAINRVLGKGGGVLALIVGLLITVAVQSSSITTSILVPLAAAGVLTLRNVFPVTLGANVGTTVTALLASTAIGTHDALEIALAHTTFNVFGILIFYPYPKLREIPIWLATRTASIATRHKTLVLVYVVGLFIVAPLVILFLA